MIFNLKKVNQEQLVNIILTAILLCYLGISVLQQKFPDKYLFFKDLLIRLLGKVNAFFVDTEVLTSPTLVLLGITIPIFVLTVTLVGRAAKVSKQKQIEQNSENKKQQETAITELKAQIESGPENVEQLKAQVRLLEQGKTSNRLELLRITRRYNALGLKDAVIVPSIAFIVSIVFQQTLYIATGLLTQSLCLLFSLITLGYGIWKVLFTLVVVQEISLTSDEEQEKELRTLVSERLVGGIVEAMTQLEHQKKPLPIFKLRESAPIKIIAGTEKEVDFEISLEKKWRR